ncbi:MAG TPA: Asp-tRNA(Asn)/Glu-tRNA(Gln) amidotransferase subunit GatB [Thermoanaerobaculia bacterium]|jgi:aspartyl-tRNA(Asn)/glutamyl-tRNA(Gln) amidotransferase subunit B|nr:Asp-tRNA(Asn)/Glu-tRNA(Gln) amidotransferase subunit GatB [Thermoanaerobaculia bacterium]
MVHSDFEAVIGLEVHVQLLTETKMFCRCPNRFGAAPNTLVCPVCLGYPGTLPVPNGRAVDLAVKLALALGCEVHPASIFARKNYFYPDLPKGYQISQFDRPLAEGGRLPLAQHDKGVRIERLHLEEDAGKLLHEAPGGGALPGESLVDFNRCGVPLVEIVSRPDMASAAEAQDFLQTLHQLLLYTGTSDGNMEEGSLRCDANVSVRRLSETELGTKTEIKNVNSFRNVARAIEHEIGRQIKVIEAGGRVEQETRSFDADSGMTRLMRGKEEAHDYRYFPEPDLPPLVLTRERIESLRAELPELPWPRRARFVAQYGLSAADAQNLTAAREMADYFEAAAAALPSNPKGIANWVMGEVLRDLKERRVEISRSISPSHLAALVGMVDAGRISNSAAKEVFAAVCQSGEEPVAAVERLGLAQVSDTSQIERWIDEVIEQNPGQVGQYRAGKAQVLGFLVGQVMKRSGGRAEPKAVQQLLRRALEREPVAGSAE